MLSVDFVQMMNNLAAAFPALMKLISSFAYIAGLVVAFRMLYSLKIYGEMRVMMSSNASIKGPLLLMLVAVVLMYLPYMMQALTVQAFGYSNPIVPDAGGTSSADAFLHAIKLFVIIIGAISFVRGWLLLTQLGQHHGSAPPGTFGKSMMHIFGGFLAYHIDMTSHILMSTFGISYS